jgi:hypothetical protein
MKSVMYTEGRGNRRQTAEGLRILEMGKGKMKVILSSIPGGGLEKS